MGGQGFIFEPSASSVALNPLSAALTLCYHDTWDLLGTYLGPTTWHMGPTSTHSLSQSYKQAPSKRGILGTLLGTVVNHIFVCFGDFTLSYISLYVIIFLPSKHESPFDHWSKSYYLQLNIVVHIYQKIIKQGNYSLRRPPKLIIPQAVIRHWEKMSFCMHIDV